MGGSILGMIVPDRHKKKWKTVVDLLGKVRSHEKIVEDLETVDDPIVERLHGKLLHVCERVHSDPHDRNLRKPGELALWIFCFDTAYRDQGLRLLEAIQFDQKLQEDVYHEVNGPDRWYVNIAQDEEIAEDLSIDEERAERILAAETHQEVLAA